MLGAFILVIIYIFLKIAFSSDEKLDEDVRRYDEERSEAIKRGIRKSKIYGTKKSRRFTDY